MRYGCNKNSTNFWKTTHFVEILQIKTHKPATITNGEGTAIRRTFNIYFILSFVCTFMRKKQCYGCDSSLLWTFPKNDS